MDSSQREESENECTFRVIEEGETGAGAVDDNDDIVELCKSLKEIVEDQTVKPRLQCLTVDPSFSMVTVQSEDSGIVWETVSSRCSTPWASEGSTTSEAYSLEGSGAQGKVIIIMDEDKIVRKRKKRSGSKLGDRLKRPSSRSFPGGNERPFMTEIAVPNIRPEGTGENGESTDLKQEKEQRLFSLVSEGYEILNIVVPSRLATVDEEESTDIADNLSYLENTPQIKSKHIQEATELPETISKTEEVKEDQEVKKVEEENVVSVEPQSSQDSVSKACGNDGTSDTDYFEKFTLLDDNLPGDVSEGAEEHVQSKVSQGSALLENQEKSTRSANEDAFVLIGDVEMASEHLDEVFYKNGGHDELVESAFIKQQERDEEESADEGRHMKSFIKESGSALFGSQETILTPIFLPSGPPKIIDPVLLEEPAALPFLYTDLYEEAMGEKKKEDDFSDVESVISEKSFKRRHSDSDDSEGYLEKFILKDETPVVEREPVESLNKGGLQMWAQSKFDLTGCLTRVEEEEEEEEDIKEEEVNTVQKPSVTMHEKVEQITTVSENKKEDMGSWHVVFEKELPSETKKTKLCKKVSEPETGIKEETETDETKSTVTEHTELMNERVISTDKKTTTDEIMQDSKEKPFVDQEPKSTPQDTVKKTEVSLDKPEKPSIVHKCESKINTEEHESKLEEPPIVQLPEGTAEGEVSLSKETIDINKLENSVQEINTESGISEIESVKTIRSAKSHTERQAKCELLNDNYITVMDYNLDVLMKESPKRDLSLEEAPDKGTPESVTQINSQLPHSGSASEDTSLTTEKVEVALQGNAIPWEADSVKVVDNVEKELVNKIKENITLKEWDSSGVQSFRDSSRVPRTQLLRLSPLIPVETDEENEEDDQKERQDVLKHREVSYSALRSFPGQVDLSMFGKEESLSDQGEKTAEELGYEMITQQEARDLEPEGAQKDELNHERDHKFSKLHDHYIPTEELLETEYEIIEAPDGTPLSEGRQEQIDSNAQAMDTFCLVCQCPIVAKDKLYGEHQDHEVLTLDEAYDDFRNKLGEWISVLQERSEKIEDLVSELELAYNSVEEHFKTCEETLDRQNQEILKLVMDQYNEMSQTMEEEKKVKLEQLYDQIVEFQDNIDLAKEALDRTVKEIEVSDQDQLTFLCSSVDINQRLTSALESSLSLELTPRAFPMFEDYSKSPSGRGRKELEGIPIPQKPRLQAQEANSATSTSVTVYWKVNEGDVIDCFQVYCMEEPQRAISEEYRVTVKESYCTLEDLEPDKNYKVWVMAVNYTGCSLPSEKLSFRTAPSIPTINTERCTICWDFAIIRWSPSDRRTAESFTLEYCRQYACEGEGLRSISGIKQCEQKVLLLPNENYLFYIKAVNTAGSSDQSEATLISTRGTRFHLLKDTAHPALELSEDMTTVHWRDGNISQRGMAGSPGVLGEVLPPRGYHYWEISVRDCQAYRIGVMYHSAAHHDALQENNTSWCLHCIPTSNSCRFHLYHDSLKTDIIAAEAPASIGTLLDFIHGRLSFFDGQSGRMLGSCCHRFSKACQAALVLDQPGSLAVCAVSEVPEFAKRH